MGVIKSDSVNNMGHMRISGTETLSLTLSQTKQLNNLKVMFKVESNVPQVPN